MNLSNANNQNKVKPIPLERLNKFYKSKSKSPIKSNKIK